MSMTDRDRYAALEWFRRNRARSRALFATVAPEAFLARPIALRHPVAFYEGHLPAFNYNTLLRRGLGRPPLDADLDVLFVRRPGQSLPEEQTTALAALRRLAQILGAHFLEEESDDVIGAVRATVIDRGTTYVYVGTPERRRLEEVVRGAFLERLIEALPGVDIRIAADRGRRRELGP